MKCVMPEEPWRGADRTYLSSDGQPCAVPRRKVVAFKDKRVGE